MNESSGQPMALEREGPGSFESFFRQHYGSLVRSLVIVSGGESEAEDLAQEAFARALERWERVSEMESPMGYVYRTAFNVHRNRVRHMVRSMRRRAEPPPIDSDPSSEIRPLQRAR